jgi:hypothetical protein
MIQLRNCEIESIIYVIESKIILIMLSLNKAVPAKYSYVFSYDKNVLRRNILSFCFICLCMFLVYIASNSF